MVVVEQGGGGGLIMRCRVREKSCLHCSAVNVQISSRLPSEMCSRQRFFVFSSYFWPPSQPIKDLRVLFQQEHDGEARPPHSHAGRWSSRFLGVFFRKKINKNGIAKFATTCSCGRFLSVTGAQRLHDNCLPIRRERVRVPHHGQNSAIPSSGSPHGLCAAAERRSFRSSASKEEADLESRTEDSGED